MELQNLGGTRGGDGPGTVGMLRHSATLCQSVTALLRTKIIAGTIAPGTLLRETALAQELGVSATPVREALSLLASEGLVEIEAHRLKRAAPVDPKATRDLIRVQVELWRLGYLWGMPHVGLRQREMLDQFIARYAAAIDSRDYMAAIVSSLEFHTIFIKASGNRELLRSTLDRRGLIARFIFLQGLETISASGLAQHKSILDAFDADDHPRVLARLDRMGARLLSLGAVEEAIAPPLQDYEKE